MSLAFHICTEIKNGLNRMTLLSSVPVLSGHNITNYATKDEASTYRDDGGNDEENLGASWSRLEQARQASDPSNAERIALEKGMRNFALRVVNRMSHDKEVSGMQVASCCGG